MADTRLDKRVKLSGALPGEGRENGLDHLADQLVDDPEGSLVLAVVQLDVRSVTHDIASDAFVPLLRIREIEAVLMDDAPAAVCEWMADVRAARREDQDTLPDEEPLPDHLDYADEGEPSPFNDETVAIVPADEDAVVRFDRGKR